ncbi:MAG: hypothetical protein VCC04_10255 [Myxococcota bacterium]
MAAVGLAVGAFFFARARTASSSLREVQEIADKRQVQLEGVRAQREEDTQQISRHASEVSDLRKRLDKAKRRAVRGGQGQGSAGAASATQAAEAELEQARRVRDAAREEALGLSQELSRVRAEAASHVQPEAPRLDDSGIEALEQKLAALEQEAAAAREESSTRKKSEARLKRKLATQEMLYVSLRSELDAKKDRLRTQQEELERLMALKAAVLDVPEPSPVEPPTAAADPEPT